MLLLATLILCSLSISCIHSLEVFVRRLEFPGEEATMCDADAGVCGSEFQFPTETTRLSISVEAKYALAIEISPVQFLGCYETYDVYVAKEPHGFSNNSLEAFKAAQEVVVFAGANQPDNKFTTTLTACNDPGTVRFNVGIRRVDNSASGLCTTGRFRLRLGDNSAACGFRRDDKQCYQGDLACRGKIGIADIVADYGDGEPIRCCPFQAWGQEAQPSVLQAPQCTCAGIDRMPVDAVPTPLIVPSSTPRCTREEKEQVEMESDKCSATFGTCTLAAGGSDSARCTCAIEFFECVNALKECKEPSTPKPTTSQERWQAEQMCMTLTHCSKEQCAAFSDKSGTTTSTAAKRTFAPVLVRPRQPLASSASTLLLAPVVLLVFSFFSFNSLN